MYCSKCGSEVEDGTKFCPECGEELQTIEDTDTENTEGKKPTARGDSLPNEEKVQKSKPRVVVEEEKYIESWNPKKLSPILLYSENGKLVEELPRYDELKSAKWNDKENPVCPNCKEYDDCLRKNMEVLVPKQSQDDDYFIERLYNSYQCKHCGHHLLRFNNEKGRIRKKSDNTLITTILGAFQKLNNENKRLENRYVGVFRSQEENVTCNFCNAIGVYVCEECGQLICDDHTKEEGGFSFIIQIIEPNLVCPDCS